MEKAAKPTRMFIHGLESSSKGIKGAFFSETYPDMIVEDFFGTFHERMTKLDALLADKNDLMLVGSSYGGLMASVFAFRTGKNIRKLVLLAPALNYMPPETHQLNTLSIPVIIYHGSQDNIVPPGPVYDIARKIFTNLTWYLVDDDHSLHKTFLTLDWDNLLS